MTEKQTTRRGALKLLGTVAVGSSAIVGATSASDRDSVAKPVLARGTRIIRRVPTDDGYRREETFEIDSTEPLSVGVRDGEVTTATEQTGRNPAVAGTVDLGKDEFEIDEQQVASQLAAQAADDVTVSAADIDVTPEDSPEKIEYEDTAVLGTVEQHYRQEMRTRDAVLSTNAIDTQAESNPLLAADCSKYTYNGDDPSDKDDLAERTGPINLAWDNGKDASTIESDMGDRGWGAPWPSSSKYIFEKPWSVKTQDTHIKKNMIPTYSPNQWHVRAYDLSYADDLEVIGAGHQDPVDHNQVCEIIGVTCDVDWKFEATREEASEEWNDVTTKWAGNGDADSSSGNYDYIEGDIKEDDGGIGCPPFCPLSEDE